MSRNLKQLIEACEKGDRKAQKQLFLRFKDALYLISLKYCGNTEEAMDNVHDTFIFIFQNMSMYKGTGSFEGWIKRICINKAIDKYNHSLNFKDYDDMNEVDTNINNTVIPVPSIEEILRLIHELPPRYRMVFSLYELDGYSHRQIGDILGISEGTSKSNLHRARNILREKLDKPKTN